MDYEINYDKKQMDIIKKSIPILIQQIKNGNPFRPRFQRKQLNFRFFRKTVYNLWNIVTDEDLSMEYEDEVVWADMFVDYLMDIDNTNNIARREQKQQPTEQDNKNSDIQKQEKESDTSNSGVQKQGKNSDTSNSGMKKPEKDSETSNSGIQKSGNDSDTQKSGMQKPEKDSETPNSGMQKPEKDSNPTNSDIQKPEKDSDTQNSGIQKPEKDSDTPNNGMQKPEKDNDTSNSGMQKQEKDSDPLISCTQKQEKENEKMKTGKQKLEQDEKFIKAENTIDQHKDKLKAGMMEESNINEMKSFIIFATSNGFLESSDIDSELIGDSLILREIMKDLNAENDQENLDMAKILIGENQTQTSSPAGNDKNQDISALAKDSKNPRKTKRKLTLARIFGIICPCFRPNKK